MLFSGCSIVSPPPPPPAIMRSHIERGFRVPYSRFRIFAHSLVFLLIFAAFCAVVFKKFFVVYAFPVLAHQVLDFMWEVPQTWFWPLQGWSFESRDMDVWEHWLEQLTSNPYIMIGELVGLGILVTVLVFFRLYLKGNSIRVLKKGRILP